ncbi:uracil-DNA glycosylase [Corynebacterium choanae]|uniref:Uracil-DNA glycosylase n=1 Tax=Corynebacterium choanae TaxID=1862358 RepID=A0A3G6J5P1_9CORY|nr:uracil-DNA glycosylase [Corynebacterium choanae]AZA13411.1 Uracil-DNA glycosylase [Corynebacterium choanae]
MTTPPHLLATIDPTWVTALAPVADQLATIETTLATRRAAGEIILPAPHHTLRALTHPIHHTRVLIVGQDPYPTPGHPIGWSFAVDRTVQPLPKSLANIYTELHSDLHITPPHHGDLTAWVDQGVMLLNRVLTVTAGAAGSHQNLGWQTITNHIIDTLVARHQPLVAILWGKQAQTLTHRLGDTPLVTSAHPSPLSAYRGFFGSKPFSTTNTLLTQQGADPIDWQLPDYTEPNNPTLW